MAKQPTVPRKSRAAAAPLSLEDAGGAAAAERPPIWAQGRQAPAFEPLVFARAGMLLARETAEEALIYLSTESSALSARVEVQDWSALRRRLGRAGPALPEPAGLARRLDGLARVAEAGRRLLYGLPDPVAAAPTPAPPATAADQARADMPTPAPGAARAEPRRPMAALRRPPAGAAGAEPRAVAADAAAPLSLDAAALPPSAPAPWPAVPPQPTPQAVAAAQPDPDLAAIRALLTEAEPPAPAMTAPRRPDQARAPDAPPQAAGSEACATADAPAPRRRPMPSLPRIPAPAIAALRWGFVRVLTGTVLAFATPVGYGRALWRHLDGTDLAEVIADCQRPRAN